MLRMFYVLCILCQTDVFCVLMPIINRTKEARESKKTTARKKRRSTTTKMYGRKKNMHTNTPSKTCRWNEKYWQWGNQNEMQKKKKRKRK